MQKRPYSDAMSAQSPSTANGALTVGEKIREIRRLRGMTQHALAGEYITRSMMCRIESGSAHPSYATLCYLAETLSVPVLYFLDESVTLCDAQKLLYLPRIKEELAASHYKECVRLIDLYFDTVDDELALILSRALLETARKAVDSGNLDTALATLERLNAYCKQTVYDTSAIEASAAILSAIASNVQSPRYEIKESLYLTAMENSTSYDLYAYLTEQIELCRAPLYRTHLEARMAMKKKDYVTAMQTLTALEEKRLEKDMNAFLLFRIYTDLETCHKELSNFQSAYRYASKRISMLAAFHS